MKEGWVAKRLNDACDVDYGTRVVQKKDGGTIFPVYGGGGATFALDTYNREDCMVVARFAMSAQCTRFVQGKFFLNDSGLTVSTKDSGQLLQRFLDWQILGLNDHIYSLSRGTAQKNLDVPAFRNVEIRYPSNLTEQERIVAKLDAAFAAIDKAKANVERNLHNAKELFQSKLNEVFSGEKEGWVEKSVQEVCNVINGYAFKSEDFSNAGQVKSIKITNVGIMDFVHTDDNLLPSGFDKTYSKVQVSAGDIVFALTRTIISGGLKIARVPTEYEGALVNQRVAALVPSENKMKGDFLYSYFTTTMATDYVLSNVNTLMQPNLSINDLKDMPIPVPPLAEQENIVQMIGILREATEQLRTHYTRKLTELETLKKSVLERAFRGEI